MSVARVAFGRSLGHHLERVKYKVRVHLVFIITDHRAVATLALYTDIRLSFPFIRSSFR